ncbi:ATP6AP2 family protein [Megaselia abdita]
MIVFNLKKMLQKLVIFPLLIASIYGDGEFSVLQSPSSLEWKGNDVLKTDSVKDLVSASVGSWACSNSEFGGLYIRDPFSTPKSSVTVFVDGLDSLSVTAKPQKTYKTVGDSYSIPADFDIWDSEKPSDDIVNVDLEKVDEHSETFANIFAEMPKPPKTPNNLKPELHSEDKLFLAQVTYINAFAEKIKSTGSVPKSLLIRIPVTGLVTAHGEKSPALDDVRKLLSESIENLLEATKQVSSGNALVSLITNKSDGLSRSKRQATAASDNTIDPKKLNIAEYYSADYPVIFNIILWFMVAFALALLAICYVIGDMDPGRDSIIYRMTSTRMKKDN